MSAPAIVSIGLATPNGVIGQDRAAALAARLAGADEPAAARLRDLYANSGIDRRAVAVVDSSGDVPFYPPSPDGVTNVPTTAERMARYAEAAPPLAERASRRALERAAVRPERVTHLVTASCTGFAAPGVEHALVDRLGLRAQVERVHVGFMGCHGAINALRVARGFVASDPDAVVLLCCVELCSLHFQYGDDPEDAVANALFADGAAAALVRAGNGPTIESTGACLLPASADAMGWRIGDRGFRMRLSRAVPAQIRRHVRPWLSEWLGASGVRVEDVAAWAVHPGGPKILEAAETALDLPPEALDASRRTLRQRGNMSSPTVLFILDDLLRAGARGPVVALAFGPGLSLEGALLRA